MADSGEVRPLRVQLAELLGWVKCEKVKDLWLGFPNELATEAREVPYYDTSWCAMGPLVEKYKIEMAFGPHVWRGWAQDSAIGSTGKTATEAACKALIHHLKGKNA